MQNTGANRGLRFLASVPISRCSGLALAMPPHVEVGQHPPRLPRSASLSPPTSTMSAPPTKGQEEAPSVPTHKFAKFNP